MSLYRFGRAGVRLAKVYAIQRVRGEDGSSCAVRVHFEGQPSVDFDADDAEALRAYVGLLALPPAPGADDEAPGAPLPLPPHEARVSPALDPKTGRPLRRPGRGGESVPGT